MATADPLQPSTPPPGGDKIRITADECRPSPGLNAGMAPRTFADGLLAAERGEVRPTTVKRLRAAVRLIAKVTRRPPDDLPLHPSELRPILDGITSVSNGVSTTRWRRAVQRVMQLASIAGVLPNKVTSDDLSEDWQVVLAAIPEDRSRRARRACLGTFARFCSFQAVEPQAVTEDHLEAYRTWRGENSLVANLPQLINATRRAFNVAVEQNALAGLRRLAARRDPRIRAMSVDAFPPSFGEALNAYLQVLRNPDPFDVRGGRRLSTATVHSRRQLVLMAASILVEKGMPVAEVTSLAPLAAEDAMRSVLIDLHDRAGRRWTPYAKGVAATLVDIGRRAVRLEPPELQKLSDLKARVRTGRVGMGSRSRERLMQFDNHEALSRLFGLPQALYAVAATRHREGAKLRAAEIHECAVALHLTLRQPLRVANLCSLDLERHFRRDPRGRIATLVIPGAETKGGVEIRTALRRELAVALERHIRDHRPLLAGGSDTTSLFPGRGGGKTRAASVLARRISRTVTHYTGADYNVHLARHLAATLLLDADPGNAPVAQRLLGHSSLKVTEQVYAAVRTRSAQAIYSNILEDRLAKRLEPGAALTARGRSDR